jgi:hypothetical protein
MFCTPSRFYVQSVKKIVNPTLKDQVKWLTNIWTQLVFNFEETQRWYRDNDGEHHKEQPRFKVKDQIWIQQQNVKTTWPLDRLDYL